MQGWVQSCFRMFTTSVRVKVKYFGDPKSQDWECIFISSMQGLVQIIIIRIIQNKQLLTVRRRYVEVAKQKA